MTEIAAPRCAALSKEEFQDLKNLDSCSVANAIERFQVQLRNEGYTEGGLACRYPFMLPVLGYAITLKVRSVASPGRGRTFLESDECGTCSRLCRRRVSSSCRTWIVTPEPAPLSTP